jgi:hypothetical protein
MMPKFYTMKGVEEPLASCSFWRHPTFVERVTKKQKKTQNTDIL